MPSNIKKTNKASYDDLTVIQGIGEARQNWIRDSFDVRTYADLAALSVDEIAAQLKKDHKLVAAGVIEDWIAQANQLARQAGEQGKWTVLATFVVVFEDDGAENHRTMVHHMESDRTEQWTGSEPHKVGDWISAQLGTKLQKPPEITPEPVQEPEPIVPENLTPPARQITSHDRLQELLAKLDALKTPKQPAPKAPVPLNPELQGILEKVQRITDTAQPPMHNEKLRRLVAKVHELEERAKAEKP